MTHISNIVDGDMILRKLTFLLPLIELEKHVTYLGPRNQVEIEFFIPHVICY